MRITYDPEADAMYIELRADPPESGQDLEPGIITHHARDGRLVGLEILDARQKLGNIELSFTILPDAEADQESGRRSASFDGPGQTTDHGRAVTAAGAANRPSARPWSPSSASLRSGTSPSGVQPRAS